MFNVPASFWQYDGTRVDARSRFNPRFGFDPTARGDGEYATLQYSPGNKTCVLAGATGAGKSATLNTILNSALQEYGVDTLHYFLLDMKNIEFYIYKERHIDGINVYFRDTLSEFEHDLSIAFTELRVANFVVIDEFQVLDTETLTKVLDMCDKHPYTYVLLASQSVSGRETVTARIHQRLCLRCSSMVSQMMMGNAAASYIKSKFGFGFYVTDAIMNPDGIQLWGLPYTPDERLFCNSILMKRKAEGTAQASAITTLDKVSLNSGSKSYVGKQGFTFPVGSHWVTVGGSTPYSVVAADPAVVATASLWYNEHYNGECVEFASGLLSYPGSVTAHVGGLENSGAADITITNNKITYRDNVVCKDVIMRPANKEAVCKLNDSDAHCLCHAQSIDYAGFLLHSIVQNNSPHAVHIVTNVPGHEYAKHVEMVRDRSITNLLKFVETRGTTLAASGVKKFEDYQKLNKGDEMQRVAYVLDDITVDTTCLGQLLKRACIVGVHVVLINPEFTVDTGRITQGFTVQVTEADGNVSYSTNHGAGNGRWYP